MKNPFPIPPNIQKRMKNVSFHPNSPVAIEHLSYVKLPFRHPKKTELQYGFMIVHQLLAKEIMEIFEEMLTTGLKIDRIEPICYFDGDDEKSMQHNNCSSFNCRLITGSKDLFSKHSYGYAVDINPLYNPYRNGDLVLPKGSDKYLTEKTIYTISDDVVQIWKRRGWNWGGDWKGEKQDYHHFEKIPFNYFGNIKSENGLLSIELNDLAFPDVVIHQMNHGDDANFQIEQKHAVIGSIKERNIVLQQPNRNLYESIQKTLYIDILPYLASAEGV